MNNSRHLLAQIGEVSSFFEGFDPEHRFVLMIIAIGCLTGLLISLGSVLAGCWSRVKDREIEADLTRDMLDHGMTADEIQKVIEATPQSGVDRWLGSWCKKK